MMRNFCTHTYICKCKQEMKKRGRALTRDECNTLLYVCQETGGPEVRTKGGREGRREGGCDN
jgi:hypothetical protein